MAHMSIAQSYFPKFSTLKQYRQTFSSHLQNIFSKILIQRQIINAWLNLLRYILCLFDESLCRLILEAKPIRKNQFSMRLDKTLKLLLNLLRKTIFGEQLQKLTFSDEIFAYIQSADEFALAIDLRVGGPPTIVAQPVPHILVLEYIVVVELYILCPEQVEQGFSEPAFWFLGGPLDKDDDW